MRLRAMAELANKYSNVKLLHKIRGSQEGKIL